MGKVHALIETLGRAKGKSNLFKIGRVFEPVSQPFGPDRAIGRPTIEILIIGGECPIKGKIKVAIVRQTVAKDVQTLSIRRCGRHKKGRQGHQSSHFGTPRQT